MSTKAQNLSDPSSCLNKAGPDEPIFVLRASDPLAPMTIMHWITMSTGQRSASKVSDAALVMNAMKEWRARNCPEPEGAA